MDNDQDLPNATPDRDYDTASELPFGLAPADRPKVPSTLPPQGACDAHLHLVGGRRDFPLWEHRKENPVPGRGLQDWLDLLRTHMTTLELTRGVIVHSTLYGDDNRVTIEALRQLGPDYRGVGLVADDVTEDRLDRLADARIRAVRLNEVFDGPLSFTGAEALAPRLAARDMHLEMLLPAARIAELEDRIARLPCPVVLDHLGWPDVESGPNDPTFEAIRRLLAGDRTFVKLSALYRLARAPYDEAKPFMEILAREAPDRCLWGSDWPHLLLETDDVPDAGILLDTFFDVITASEARQTILVDAPAQLYGF